MKILVEVSRWIVGLLFIFSGFVKLNDPIGFSFKLEEYFSPSVLDLEFLAPFALIIAILVVVFELVLGIMLLIGYLPKFTTWALLLMVIFFGFLTFYSAYYNKVTDCGCFGDAIPLTPWQSFYKDMILLGLILILFFNQKYITPYFARASHRWIVFLSFMLCFIFAYYVLMHLPVFDFRAYKKGTNISQAMTVPQGAPEAVYDYNWKFLVNGEEEIFTTRGAYPNVDGEFIEVETELVQKGYEPPIHDFSIEKDGENHISSLLAEDKLLMVVAYSLRRSENPGLQKLDAVIERARNNGYRVIGLSASGEELKEQINEKFGFELDWYFSDETALKTIIRSNPGLVKLHKGTIVEKLHWNDAEKLQF
ncbi:DoxX family protein [Salinimicrobium tongyeongense]|uniref:DoxX family protein n=1 Tax=Salinimicrobium tongyeongense TaxID=2809707 RepID=A0ABY6NPA3_9FLAO|nr:BT_3928 family protein [Salinimicrobium tongyeongense]UZH54393.1 DoxX family protein [Salinimicrobium tongyeongense]